MLKAKRKRPKRILKITRKKNTKNKHIDAIEDKTDNAVSKDKQDSVDETGLEEADCIQKSFP